MRAGRLPAAILVLSALAGGMESVPASAAIPKAQRRGDSAGSEKAGLVDRLESIRARALDTERQLILALKSQKLAQSSLRTVQALMKLRREERDLGRRRLAELESTVASLEGRREQLQMGISEHQKAIRRFLIAIDRAEQEPIRRDWLKEEAFAEREKLESARRKVLAGLTSRSLREVEMLKVDLVDSEELEERISEERRQLTELFQDLDEKEGLLELNRQLRADILEQKHAERVAQLESYRRLKSAESEVERLISAFNARVELQKSVESERAAARAMAQGAFARLRGRLPMPLGGGTVLSLFGRNFDAKSKLHVFRKGIEIAPAEKKSERVQAVSGGKVAYSGELPGYGRVAILDHGDHYYSLYGHLGTLSRKPGEAVAAGDAIGLTDDSGSPVYFEIRERNVAVNPLQWFSN